VLECIRERSAAALGNRWGAWRRWNSRIAMILVGSAAIPGNLGADRIQGQRCLRGGCEDCLQPLSRNFMQLRLQLGHNWSITCETQLKSRLKFALNS
jgi:hypothetical protein